MRTTANFYKVEPVLTLIDDIVRKSPILWLRFKGWMTVLRMMVRVRDPYKHEDTQY